MSKKNPYENASDFNPDDILDNLRDRRTVPDMGEEQEIFSTAPLYGDEALSDQQVAALAKERVCPNCPSGREADEARLRALAEVDNIRKRMLREKEESVRFAASNVLTDILPSLDNLDLALEHAKGKEACLDFFIGVEMTKKLMLDALKRHGLEPIGSVGEEFDPAVHEAVGMNADPNVDNGAICTILNKGYKLHERLLRPARVVVCKK